MTVSVLWLFLMVPLNGLRYVIVVFPARTDLLLVSFIALLELHTNSRDAMLSIKGDSNPNDKCFIRKSPMNHEICNTSIIKIG